MSSKEINSKIEIPDFFNEEIKWLYSHGLYIGKEKIDILLNLKRESLINDLELVIQDSIKRYKYFEAYVEENGLQEDEMNFVVHAVFLLGEIEAKESNQILLELLSQSREYLNLFLGDFLTEALWEPALKMLADDLNIYKPFVTNTNLLSYSRSVITDMLAEMTWHLHEKKEQVLSFYEEILDHFLTLNKIDKELENAEFISFVVCNIIDLRASELLPKIKMLDDKGLISRIICGTYKEVEETLLQENFSIIRQEILPIADRYLNITSTWAGYNEEANAEIVNYFDNLDLDSRFAQLELLDTKPIISEPVRTEPKIGRNEPCPCGSGKKYKKCCLNN